MSSNTMWMVRAERGVLYDLFREKSIVAIGWGAIGPLTYKRSTLGPAIPAFTLEVIDAGRHVQPHHDVLWAMLLRLLLGWELQLSEA